MFLLTATLLVHHWDYIIFWIHRKNSKRNCAECLSRFLAMDPGSKDILLYDRYKDFADKLIAEADVSVVSTSNALKRIDDMADAVAASPARKIMIDHHLYPE